MKRFAVIGHPIGHSLSPKLHRAGFSELEIDAEFVSIDVKPENLEQWLKFEGRNLDGIAVTAPHKETIRKFIDQETEVVGKIGAVNTLYWQDQKLTGTNTDSLGALRALQSTNNPGGKHVFVLGAGGAARAVVFALQMAKSHIALWNRSSEKAEKLITDLETNSKNAPKIVLAPEIDDVDPDKIDIVINATSVGLNEWKSILPEDFWCPHHTAFDIVYSPLETKFLADAADAGAQTITGDQMLIHQALEQFRIWHNTEVEPEIMERAFFE